MSQKSDGDLVRVPRPGTDRTPRTLAIIDSDGMSLGGGEAASANGWVDSRRWLAEKSSTQVRIEERVPPLAPEDLYVLERGKPYAYMEFIVAYFSSHIAPVISLVWHASFSRTSFTIAQTNMSAGALSMPTQWIICSVIRRLS